MKDRVGALADLVPFLGYSNRVDTFPVFNVCLVPSRLCDSRLASGDLGRSEIESVRCCDVGAALGGPNESKTEC